MTTKMVADYYEVGYDTVRVCYQCNKEEIESDGVQMTSLQTLKAHFVPTMIEHGKCIFKITNDITLEVPNRGVKVFPKRAILRIGMLLRDSEVAKEVRTQLLNTFEHSTDEQKTFEIDEEMRLKMNIGIAYASGDMDELTKANMEYNAYKNRYEWNFDRADSLIGFKSSVDFLRGQDAPTRIEPLNGLILRWLEMNLLIFEPIL